MKSKKMTKIINLMATILTILGMIGPFSWHGALVAQAVETGATTVTGTVTEPDATTPVPYAYVNIHNSNWSVYFSTSADANGVFSFTLMPAGSYTLEVYGYHAVYKDPLPQVITVPSSGTLDVGVITLNEANVSGLVTKIDGTTPVSGAGINIHNSDWTVTRYSSTDGSGAFGVYLASSGTYTLEVYANDPEEANPAPITFSFTAGGTRSFTGASKITLSAPSITGQVLMPDGVTGAQNVSINIHDNSYSYENSDYANTDSMGMFKTKALASGTYKLDVNASNAGFGLVAPEGLSITVTAGTTNNYFITSPIQLEQAHKTISGTVTRPDGTKVTDAMVNAWRQDGGMGYASTQTNSQGSFTMTVSTGKWQVMVNPTWTQGAQPDWGYYKSAKTVTFTGVNSVVESQTANFEVTLFDATISGRVLKPNGTAADAATAQVSAWSSGGMGGGNWAQPSDSGYFSLKIPAGTYQIDVMPFNNENYGSPETDLVTVASGENYNIGTVSLVEKNEFITGKVVDNNGTPLSNQNVNAWKQTGMGWGWAQTDENGEYSLALTPGVWFVDAMAGGGTAAGGAGGGGGEETVYVKTQQPQKVVLSAEETRENVNFTFTIADATINGTVQDAEGNVLTDLFAWAEAIDVNRSMTQGGEMMGYGGLGGQVQNGSFAIKVPAGTFNLGVFMPWGSDYTASSQTTVTVSEGGTYDGAVVTVLPNNATITGSLLDGDGNPVTDVWGEVFVDNGAGGNQWAQFEDGAYTLKVSAGDWRIGYWIDPLSGYLSSASHDNKVTAVANTTSEFDLTLLKADSTITGTVLDADGNPLKNAFVSADTELGGQSSMEGQGSFYGMMSNQGNISDSEGNFTLSVPAGEYFISASLPPEEGLINPKAQKVTVDADNPAEVTLQFRASDGTISGDVILTGELNEAFVWGWSEDGGASQVTTYDGHYTLNVTKGETWHIGAIYETTIKFYRSDENIVSVPASGAATQNLELVETDITIPAAETATFDATVGQVMRLTDGTEVNMPAYSIATEGNVTVTATPKASVAATATAKPIALAYDLVAKDEQNQSITSFNGNVTIKLFYTEAQLEALGITATDITCSYYDETTGTWRSVDNVVINPDEMSISFTVNHFTSFAIITGKVGIAADQELDLTLSSPVDNSSVNVDTVVVSGLVSDATAAVTVSLNEGDDLSVTVDEDGTFSQTITDLQAGTNTIQVEAVKGVNTASITRTVYYTLGEGDGLPPAATGTESSLVTIPQSGGPQVRVFDNQGNLASSFFAYNKELRGTFNVVTADINDDGYREIITYPSAGFSPQVRVFDHRGTFITQFYTHQQTFRGGIEITVADVDGDGVADLISKPAQDGSANIRVFKYNSTTEGFEALDWFMAYQETFRQKVNLIAADIDNDGSSEIVTAPAIGGGPNVRIYKYNSTTEQIELLDWFMAYADSFRGGVNISAANVLGDATKEIIATPASAGGPNVRVYQYDQTTGEFSLVDWFMAYQETYRGGVKILLTDVNSDGLGEIITTPTNGSTNVRVYAYNSSTEQFDLLDWFWAYDENFRGGANVVAANIDGDGYNEIVATPASAGGPNVRVYEYNPTTSQMEVLDWFMAYADSFRGQLGIKVADLEGDGDSEIITAPLTSGGPNIRILNYTNGNLSSQYGFMAYADSFRGGVKVTTGY